MAQQNLDLGVYGDENTGEYVGESLIKVEANFTDLYTNKANDSEVVHNTGDETLTGTKTFNGTGPILSDTVNNRSPKLNFSNYIEQGTFNGNYNRIYFKDSKFHIKKLGQSSSDGGLIFDQSNTAERTYTFPDKSGTVALLSDIGADTLDTTPLLGSTNAVQSNGIYLALADIDTYVPNNALRGLSLQDNSIPESKLQTFNASKIQDGSITTVKYQNLSITNSKISENSIDPRTIDDSENGGPTNGDALTYLDGEFLWSSFPVYSEGTFTPTLTAATSGGYSVSVAEGTYTRIGKQVFVRVRFTGINNTGTPTGTLQVNNLPFVADEEFLLNARINNVTSGSQSSIQASIYSGGTQLTFYTQVGGNIFSSVSFSNGVLVVSGTYITT